MLSSTFFTISVFCGSSSSTADLVLRKINGAMSFFRCLREASSLFLMNRSVKWARVPNNPGFIKLNRFHTSPKWFCTGVPVSATRNGACNIITALEVLVVKFFIEWASSSIMVAKPALANSTASDCIRPYEATKISPASRPANVSSRLPDVSVLMFNEGANRVVSLIQLSYNFV